MQYIDRRHVRSVAVLLVVNYFLLTGAQEWDICKERSCYPATGNLLIGREHRLTATSTCGVPKPERYCIVSHLEDKKKCFMCDSRKPWARYTNERSHRIENVVSDRYEMRSKRWWQSANGVRNVSIQLDLEAEFHFTHLIMTFKSFRPAAMFIERSSDFGKTWKVYRYFAYDCADSFPGFAEGLPRRHTDVVCDSRYSFVAPSTGGEVVFKVLSPHIELEDPYSEQIQDLLRVTNLRIILTKLHTLGDNLLDNRLEIAEKYYYAIYEMVVRGSCSCYGHARRCIPIEEQDDNYGPARPDMVYGRCECAHHTKGLNCEECEDFYNDLPWKPAIDRETNACKRCNCNQHAARCHFDHAVFEASGYVSGGVCDDCQHNTMGKNCETCKPYFHRDPERNVTDPYTCRPCDCDLRGSLNQGICDSETDAQRNLVSGRCHCKANVLGERCDQCKNGFWNLDEDNADGCAPCSCHLLGTIDNRGCDKRTGECTCKRLVTGDNCDRCLDEHYGLGEQEDGCKPCDCDLGGARHNRCDANNGQCQCRRHFAGRRCDRPESGYYCANLDFFTYEAEAAKLDGPTDLEPRQPTAADRPSWTGTGFVRVRDTSTLSMVVQNILVPMDYHVMLRYESTMPAAWKEVRIDVVRPSPPHPDGPCANAMPKDDLFVLSIEPGVGHYESESTVCLEPNVQYHVRITVGPYDGSGGFSDRSASMLIDSLLLVPSLNGIGVLNAAESDDAAHRRREYDYYRCRQLALQLTDVDALPEACQRLFCPVAASIVDQGMQCDCDPTGSVSGICNPLGGQCRCKANVIGRRCDQCAPGTFGFGPKGCTSCDCDSIGALDNFCDLNAGGQCKCRPGVYGRQCDQCQPGFWGFPECRQCQCNGHADVCDQRTGACVECRDLTSGHHCELCQDGYYGDPRIGISIACRPCPCPGGPGSGFQHADTCYLDRSTETVLCNCRHGYEGERCDRCIINFWGNPNEVGGSCERCDCNGNIDFDVPNSCDSKTGRCLKCIYNTDGYQCEHCMPGFFGDARTQSCEKCVCNMLGTDITAGPCDRITGQCPCLPNVVGIQCDACAENHWKIASGTGCEPCRCDPNGVVLAPDADGQRPSLQCNEFDGQCPCRPGRGGRTCDQCEDYYWGDPTANECRRCQCNPLGSATLQCDRGDGSCVCLNGSGGFNCDQCARGYTGTWPQCEPCGECFAQWDATLADLKAETDRLQHNATNIADSGVSFVYDDELRRIEGKLAVVRDQLASSNVSSQTMDQLRAQCERLDAHLEHVGGRLNAVDARSTTLTANVDKAEQHLSTLREEVDKLRATVERLELNVTRLRETDAQGAYNVTREAAQLSLQAQQRADASERIVGQSEAERRRTKQLLEANAQDFQEQFKHNQDAMDALEAGTETLRNMLPELNRLVCGAKTDGCDELCGGAGCGPGRCGGASCRDGAVTKSEQAAQFSKEALDKLKTKQRESNELLMDVRRAQSDSSSALLDAKQAYETAVRVAQVADDARSTLSGLLERANGFLKSDGATPEQIRAIAEQVLNMTIALDKEHIEALAKDIGATLKKLTNIDDILADTRSNITAAQQLKSRADQAKVRIETVERAAHEVINALNDSRRYQAIAGQAIASARDNFRGAQQDLVDIGQATDKTNDALRSCSKAVVDLKDGLKKVEVEYLQIGKDVERSLLVSNASRQKMHDADELRKALDDRYGQAETMLQRKTGQNEAARHRAEQLRQAATKLLEKTEKHLTDIEELRKIVVVNEVTVLEVDARLSALLGSVEEVDRGIQYYLKGYERCSCSSGDRAAAANDDGSCSLQI